jgi:preprotein translocase subunit SecD
MAKNLRWRLLAIAAVVAIGVWMIYPLDQKVRLGLDLKGGVHLVLRVQTDEALRVESEASMERLRSELAKAGATGVTATLVSPTIFEIRGVPEAQTALVRQLATELEHTFNRESGAGGTYRFVMKPNIAVQMANDTVAQAIRTIENRVNELGVAEPVVARHGDADQILVQLPGVTDVGRAKEIIRSTALLELKLVEQGPADSREALLQASNGAEPPGQEVVSGIGDAAAPGQRPSTMYYLVQKTPVITGRDLRTARPTSP